MNETLNVRVRSTRWRRVAIALVLAGSAAGIAVQTPAQADAPPTWDYVYGDPGPANYSSYLDVALSKDGSTYLGGYFSGSFFGLSSPTKYKHFLQKVSADGTVLWTTAFFSDFTVTPAAGAMLVVADGLGNPFARVCGAGDGSGGAECDWQAFDPAAGTVGPHLFVSMGDGQDVPTGAAAGGVLTLMSHYSDPGPDYALRHLLPDLTVDWTASLVDVLDQPAYGTSNAVVQSSDGSVWAVGAQKRPLPTLQDSMTMAHFTAAGASIANVKNYGYLPVTAPTIGPIFGVSPDTIWVRVQPSGQAATIGAFSASDGHLLGAIPTHLPDEAIPAGSGTVNCSGVSLATPLAAGAPLTPPALAAAAVLVDGTRLVVVARCQATVGSSSSTTVVVSYIRTGDFGGTLQRVASRALNSNVTFTAMDADNAGNVVVAGSTTDSAVFSGPSQTRPSTEIAANDRAVASRNPSGNLFTATPAAGPGGGAGGSAGFVAVSPLRVFDSRPGSPQGVVSVVQQRYGGGNVLRVKVAGVGGVPTSGVGAVSLNVTAVDPVAAGFVTVFPCGDRPTVSSLNYVSGQVVPNAVIAPVSAAGEVCLFSSADSYLIADINGWFASGAGFAAVTPTRVFDSRPGSPQGAVSVVQQRYGGGNVLRVKVAGVAGVPTSGVGAVSLNVTAVDPVAAGFVTVFPCGDRPTVSSLNYVSGQVVPNAVIAPVSAAGEVCFYSSVDTFLIADINGWFASGAGFAAVTPTRVFDSRPGSPQGAVSVVQQRYGGGNVLRVKVAGVAAVPASGVGAVSLNVTAVDPVAAGFVTVFPCGDRPTVSSLNYVEGQVVPNAVIAPVSAAGEVCFYSSADSYLIADINGWFAA